MVDKSLKIIKLIKNAVSLTLISLVFSFSAVYQLWYTSVVVSLFSSF
jgi:hypothetical protein